MPTNHTPDNYSTVTAFVQLQKDLLASTAAECELVEQVLRESRAVRPAPLLGWEQVAQPQVLRDQLAVQPGEAS